MTGSYGVLLINGEEMVEQFMANCITCRKNRMLHYITPVGMSDSRMLPTVHPFAQVSIDPITSWPIILSDDSIKKLPVLIVLCRQTGFVWHKILFNWSTNSFTLARVRPKPNSSAELFGLAIVRLRFRGTELSILKVRLRLRGTELFLKKFLLNRTVRPNI